MNVTLDLPQDLERELAAKADRLGVALEEYAIRLLAEGAREARAPRTGPEIVEYWQRENLIGYRSDIRNSAMHARRLRHEAQRRGEG